MFTTVDANYSFIFGDVGKQGSLGDSIVFSECWLGKKKLQRKIKFSRCTAPN